MRYAARDLKSQRFADGIEPVRETSCWKKKISGAIAVEAALVSIKVDQIVQAPLF